MLEETRPDHVIYNAVISTKLPLMLRQPEEEQQPKGEMWFYEKYSTFVLLTFWLSYCTQSFLITSRTYYTNFLDQCFPKAGIFEFRFGIKPIGKG